MIKPNQLIQLDKLIAKLERKLAKTFRESMENAAFDIDVPALINALNDRNITQALNLVDITPGALFELDESIRSAYLAGGAFVTEDMPKILRGKFAFNGRHFRAEQWVSENVGNLIQGITEETLQTTRSVIETGLRENRTPKQIARDITGRTVGGKRVGGFLGLNSDQTDQVIKARSILSDPDKIRSYFIKDRVTGKMKPRFKLSNRRFDKVIREAIENGTALSGRTLDRVIDAHKTKALGYRGRVIAKDQTFRAIAAGRDEGYVQMLERDEVQSVTKRWQHNLSENPRDDHVAMNGTVVDLSEKFVFPDGDQLKHSHDPEGGAEHNVGCHCTTFYRVQVAKN